MSYFIGQRVIMGNEICTIVSPPKGQRAHFGMWVFVPSKGYASDYALTSFRPLPGGQL